MTETTLVPTATDARDLSQMLKDLLDQKPDASKAVQKSVNATELLQVRADATKALSTLQDRLRAVKLPSERRELAPKELDEIADLVVTAKTAIEAVNAAVNGGKEAVFNDFDVQLEKAGKAAELEVDKYGHYLYKQEVYVDAVGKRLTRELREDQPKIDAKALRQLYQDGVISRRDYMAATVHVEVPREVNDEGLTELLKRKPELLTKIRPAIVPGKVTAAFYVREPKKEDGRRA